MSKAAAIAGAAGSVGGQGDQAGGVWRPLAQAALNAELWKSRVERHAEQVKPGVERGGVALAVVTVSAPELPAENCTAAGGWR